MALVKPLGSLIDVHVYHEYAFLKMGSAKEAKEVVDHFFKTPVKNDKVVSFQPIPAGKMWKNELVAAAKRFGPVAFTLTKSTQVVIEMIKALDAKTMVEHHKSNPLIIEGETVELDFSTEYFTLNHLGRGSKSSTRKRKTSRSQSREDKPAPSSSSKHETKRRTSAGGGQTKTPPTSTKEPASANKKAEKKKGEIKNAVPENRESLRGRSTETTEAPRKRESPTEDSPETAHEDEEAPDLPENFEDLITLDEIEESSSDEKEEKSNNGSKVVYCHLHVNNFYQDKDFINIFKCYGRVVRYILIRTKGEAFVEMSSCASVDAVIAAGRKKKIAFKGGHVRPSYCFKYRTLVMGASFRRQVAIKYEKIRSKDKKRKESSSTEGTGNKLEIFTPTAGGEEISENQGETSVSVDKSSNLGDAVDKVMSEVAEDEAAISADPPVLDGEKDKTRSEEAPETENRKTAVTEGPPSEDTASAREKEREEEEEEGPERTKEKVTSGIDKEEPEEERKEMIPEKKKTSGTETETATQAPGSVSEPSQTETLEPPGKRRRRGYRGPKAAAAVNRETEVEARVSGATRRSARNQPEPEPTAEAAETEESTTQEGPDNEEVPKKKAKRELSPKTTAKRTEDSLQNVEKDTPQSVAKLIVLIERTNVTECVIQNAVEMTESTQNTAEVEEPPQVKTKDSQTTPEEDKPIEDTTEKDDEMDEAPGKRCVATRGRRRAPSRRPAARKAANKKTAESEEVTEPTVAEEEEGVRPEEQGQPEGDSDKPSITSEVQEISGAGDDDASADKGCQPSEDIEGEVAPKEATPGPEQAEEEAKVVTDPDSQKKSDTAPQEESTLEVESTEKDDERDEAAGNRRVTRRGSGRTPARRPAARKAANKKMAESEEVTEPATAVEETVKETAECPEEVSLKRDVRPEEQGKPEGDTDKPSITSEVREASSAGDDDARDVSARNGNKQSSPPEEQTDPEVKTDRQPSEDIKCELPPEEAAPGPEQAEEEAKMVTEPDSQKSDTAPREEGTLEEENTEVEAPGKRCVTRRGCRRAPASRPAVRKAANKKMAESEEVTGPTTAEEEEEAARENTQCPEEVSLKQDVRPEEQGQPEGDTDKPVGDCQLAHDIKDELVPEQATPGPEQPEEEARSVTEVDSQKKKSDTAPQEESTLEEENASELPSDSKSEPEPGETKPDIEKSQTHLEMEAPSGSEIKSENGETIPEAETDTETAPQRTEPTLEENTEKKEPDAAIDAGTAKASTSMLGTSDGKTEISVEKSKPAESQAQDLAEMAAEPSSQQQCEPTPENTQPEQNEPEPEMKLPGGQNPDSVEFSMDLDELSDPVGTEFIQPVTGYLCNLCKVIYVTEDEATIHCRRRSHHEKFKEQACEDAGAAQ